MKKTTIISAVVIIVLVTIAVWFFVYKNPTKKEEVKVDTGAASLGGALSNGVGDVQPMEKIPNVNPFNSVETNPYKSGYTNPFGN